MQHLQAAAESSRVETPIITAALWAFIACIEAAITNSLSPNLISALFRQCVLLHEAARADMFEIVGMQHMFASWLYGGARDVRAAQVELQKCFDAVEWFEEHESGEASAEEMASIRTQVRCLLSCAVFFAPCVQSWLRSDIAVFEDLLEQIIVFVFQGSYILGFVC
jgi:hypothetical protein